MSKLISNPTECGYCDIQDESQERVKKHEQLAHLEDKDKTDSFDESDVESDFEVILDVEDN